MDSFKKFLTGKKVNKHFKKSGPGHRLDGGGSSSNAPSITTGAAQGGGVDRVAAADVAAQAAFKRLHKSEPPPPTSSQKRIQMIALRELEEERRQMREGMDKLSLEEQRHEPDVREFEHSDVIRGVYYTCELLGDDVCMSKNDLLEAIDNFLTEQLSSDDDDKVIPAILLLYSLNKQAAKEVAIETIAKYLQNVIENPDDPKFRRIRMANKAFQERVASVRGGREVLTAIGFHEKEEPLKEGEPLEAFLVMDESTAKDTGRLLTALDSLRDGQSVPIKLSRDVQIFLLRDRERITVPKVPQEFYNLTAEEIKKEQTAKTEEVERMLSLRTKEMRERDERLRQYRYKYTLIRIRFPDRYVLQGTFACNEPVQSVREFVSEYLANPTATFSLRDPSVGTRVEKEDDTLGVAGLAPAAVLHFEWDEPVGGLCMAEEHLAEAQPFSAVQ